MSVSITQFRMDIGDTGEVTTFTDDELTYFIERAEGHVTKAKVYLIDRLIADNHKLHTWSAGDKGGSPGQVVSNLLLWRKALLDELSNASLTGAAGDIVGGIVEWE